MDQNKINKIALIALLFSLISLAGTSGLSGSIYNYYNYTTNNYTNASTDYDLKNYTNTYQWVNNSTMASDNTKFNKSGDSISGSIFGNRVRGKTGSFTFNDLNNSANRSLSYFAANRIFNLTTQVWELNDIKSKNAMSFTLDGGNDAGTVTPKLRLQVFENYTISPYDAYKFENTSFIISYMVGSGNAYVCIDATGKQYRGSPTC